VDLDLTPCDYVFAEWYAGFFVPAEGGGVRAGWLRAGGERSAVSDQPSAGKSQSDGR
jgi:hypothetical protein